MGSKFPKDLLSSPDGKSHKSLGNEGRQLRSRLVELCQTCQKPLPGVSGKLFPSQISCICSTPPNAPTTEFDVQKSPKKRRIESEIGGESSKRQLFRESSFSEIVVKNDPPLQGISSLFSAGNLRNECKSNKNNKRNEVRSRHICVVCSKLFNTPGKLNQHMYSHTGEKPFVCSHCSKAFSSKFKLVRHILIHSDQRQYRCTICERTFHRKDHLKNHSKVHSPVKRRFKCDRVNCGKEYSSVLSYRKHVAVHFAEEGNLECKICSKRFGSKEETLLHLKVHAGSRSLKTPADRKYHCDHCDRSFFTGKDVRRHSVVHTGRRDFLCQYCPQRFGRKDHLTRHIKKSHMSTAKKTKIKKSTIQEAAKNKSFDNILREILDDKSSLKQIDTKMETKTTIGNENMFSMQNIDESAGIMKLESSSDVIPFVNCDVKVPSVCMKDEDNLNNIYNMLETANISYKYENVAFDSNFPYNQESIAIPGPSTYHASIPQIIFQPSLPYSPELTFGLSDTDGSVMNSEANIKVESDESSTLDLVLPPITNISPSLGSSLLSSPDFHHLLTTNTTSHTTVDINNTSSRNNTNNQIYNFSPSSNELIASLFAINSSNIETRSTPLPGFNQAFQQPP